MSISTWAIASTGGVTSATWRQRDRRVIAMSSGSTDGAHSRNTVDGGGSSTTLSSAFAAPSVSRSASSIDDDLPAARAGPPRRDLHDVAHLVDADRQPLGDDPAHVGVRARHRRRARAALTAAGHTVGGALQRRGEAHRGDRPPRPRRPGDQPRVCHGPGGAPHCERNHRAPPARRRSAPPRRRPGPPDARKPRSSHDNSSAANADTSRSQTAPIRRQPGPIRLIG